MVQTVPCRTARELSFCSPLGPFGSNRADIFEIYMRFCGEMFRTVPPPPPPPRPRFSVLGLRCPRSARQLACTTLNITLTCAQSASAIVGSIAAGSRSRASGRSWGGGTLWDCIQMVGDSVNQLPWSLKELAWMLWRGALSSRGT
ncbi:hypothetical protein Taro_002692 [Colocasia esculenta]|uniref:Uncharacterized protein n=1 Tax=Colocasia esculenta TaxID=4460 RepID=A0A843TM89_COLES|nr:hypothetical protein [Colocasia esculenta]